MSDKYRGYYDRDLEDEFHRGDRGDHELLNELDQREYVVDGDELLTKEQASMREYEAEEEEKERKRQEKRKAEYWDDDDWDDQYQESESSSAGAGFIGLLMGLGVIGVIIYIFSSFFQM